MKFWRLLTPIAACAAFCATADARPAHHTASHAATAHETARTQIAWFQSKNIFHSGLMGTHTVALTFDDGPSVNTPALLRVLKKEQVPGTFFIVGAMAKKHPEVLAQIAADGHLLANHSATHPQLGARYIRHPELLVDQIRSTHDLIAPHMAKNDTLFFRAPYGYWKAQHAMVLNADPVLKHYIGPIYWDEGGAIEHNKDGEVTAAADWACWARHWTPEACAQGYLREIERHKGGIVIMHTLKVQSAELVAALVPELKSDGYRFVRLDAIPEFDKYRTPDEGPAIALASNAKPKK
jgi:peptidoglycan/xylan/chitin deacetylase (PgdA/CDA1 family)